MGGTPNIQTILADDNFKSLPIGEKHKVLLKVDPNYSGLPPREQAHALGVIQWGPDVQPDKADGSTLARSIYGFGRGLNNAVEGIYQTVVHPINTASGIASQIEDIPSKVREANKEPSTVGKIAGYGAAVPVLGPFGKQLGERAAAGDYAGAITEGVTTAAAPFAAKEIAKAAPIDSENVKSTGRAVARDVAKKYVGKTLADKVLPPPPEPATPAETPEDYARRTVAKQAAVRAEQERTGMRRPSADVEAEKAAKAHEAAYNKEAAEHDAIRKRYEDEKAAQAKAEQAEHAHREKAAAAHEKSLRDYEAARQRELAATEKLRTMHAEDIERRGKQQGALDKGHADRLAAAEKEVNDAHRATERLRTMHGSDLMKRGAEQKGLDAEAERLAGETKTATAKAAATKTELGQRLAKLNSLRVARAEAEATAGGPSSVSPDVWKELSPMDKGRIVARYENTKLRASERGMVHAGRGSSGAQLSNDAMRTRTGFPPPPEP